MCLALVDAARAGWSTNAWPSESRWQGASVSTQVFVVVTNVVGTGEYGSYTQTVFTTIIAGTNYAQYEDFYPYLVATNLVLDVRERRAYECFLAAQERTLFLRLLNRIDDNVPTPTYFYRNERESLVAIKQWMGALLDTDVAGYYIANRDSADANGGTFGGMSYSEPINYSGWESVFTNLNIPTNYLSYTPWRALHGGGRQYGRVTTNTVILVATNGAVGPVYTNTVTDMWGQSIEIVGTNGQTFARVVTNESILAGFTTGDYGWKPITNIFNRIARPMTSGTISDDGTNAYINFVAWDYGTAPCDFTLHFYRYDPPTFDPWTQDGTGAGSAGDSSATATRTTSAGGLYEHFVFFPSWQFP